MASTSYPQSCCSVACCLVPAAGFPLGSMPAAQPMQMFVMAPGYTADMAPFSYSSADSNQFLANQGQWTWPVDGSWLNLNEQAPQQLPMGVDITQMTPTQYHMDTPMAPSLASKQPSSNNLRQRRLNTCHTEASHTQAACELDNESEDSLKSEAQAREVAAELLRGLSTGAEAQWSVLSRFQHLAFANQASCRAAQLALQDASSSQATLLASSLQGHVRRAAQSKHANYVVQKIVEVIPMARASFIVEELSGFAHEAACHRFGCRLLCRILEHLSPGDTATLDLLDEMLMNVEELCSHSFGSYVVRHILEFGLPQHKRRIASALLPRVGWYAKHRLASHVVESALKSCSPADQRALAKALLADSQAAVLATNQFGRHVMRALLAMPAEIRQEAEEALKQAEGQLKHSRFGKGMLQLLPAGSTRARF